MENYIYLPVFSIHRKSAKGDKSYHVTLHKNGEFWLENELDEGMTLHDCELFDLFDKYFKESF